MQNNKLYQDKQWLSEKIKTNNATEIGRMSGVSDDTISYWIRKYDLKNNRDVMYHRKTKLDMHFFDSIDTEEKAYWLGFLMADGCISTSNKTTKNNRLSIVLNIADINHLEKFKLAISSNSKIREKTFYDKRGFSTTACSLNINSKILCESLIRHGIVPRKTGHEYIPNSVDIKYVRDFIRGFFDGDGSICKTSNNSKFYRIHLGSCSEAIIKQVQKYINDSCGIFINYYVSYKYTKPFFTLDSDKRESCNMFLHELYDNATIYLDRKMALAKNMFKVCTPIS